MTRHLAALACALVLCAPSAAMVGGAPPANDTAGRAVVLLVGLGGTSCSGVALARDLVLTAAHCLAAGGIKLVDFDAARQPLLKDIARSATHPQYDADAARRQRVTADLALLKLKAPLAVAPAALAPPGGNVAPGDRFTVIGMGVAIAGDGKSGGTARAATLVATGRPGNLQIRLVDPGTNGKRAGLGACTGDSGAPVFRDLGGALAVAGVVSWSTGPNNSEGCGGLTGVTPLVRYRAWIVEQARRMGAQIGP
jgi:hypothetical protein